MPALPWIAYGVLILKAFAGVPAVRMEDAILLKPSESPKLFSALERLRHLCSAPAFKAVHVDGEMNAAICQTGTSRHVLTIGLPLRRRGSIRGLHAGEPPAQAGPVKGVPPSRIPPDGAG